MSLLRSVYRRPCVDYEGLVNPVDLWLAGGGRFHPKPRRKIPSPAEVLPCWRRGIEAVVSNPALRDVFWFGMYTGMRLGEVLPLKWGACEPGRRWSFVWTTPRRGRRWSCPSPGSSQPFSIAAGPRAVT